MKIGRAHATCSGSRFLVRRGNVAPQQRSHVWEGARIRYMREEEDHVFFSEMQRGSCKDIEGTWDGNDAHSSSVTLL